MPAPVAASSGSLVTFQYIVRQLVGLMAQPGVDSLDIPPDRDFAKAFTFAATT